VTVKQQKLVSQTQKRSIIVQARRLDVLRLRKAGLSQREIAAKVGVSKRTVETDLQAVFEELREVRVLETEGFLDLELSRLDSLLKPFYAKAIKGDELALRSTLEILDRRYKLLGLTKALNINIEVENILGSLMHQLGAELLPEISAQVLPVLERLALEA
jgi:DNA-binding CsgD family transcriptional regulator